MARMATKTLAGLCRRLALATSSGIDDRTIWQREAERAGGRNSLALHSICDAVQSGLSTADAVATTDKTFPPLFHEFVALGEETGKLSEVYRQLADHYEHRVKLRRDFLAGITWPMIQLAAAILIVGFLIWILGVIGERFGDAPYDILGLGLRGGKGLLIYIAGVCTFFGSLIAAYFVLIRSGFAWTKPVQAITLQIPGIGGCLRTLAVARVAWTLGLAFNAGMEARRAVPLAIQSAQNYFYTRHVASAAATVEGGGTVYDAFADTGAFPREFLDALDVAERSGQMDQYLMRLSDQYQDQARSALARLTTIGAFLVWALVAAVIIGLLINLVSSYSNFIQDMAR